MKHKVRIFNEFGIKPTFNHVAAGADFYIPYFDVDKKDIAFKAFEISYKVNDTYIDNVYNAIIYFLKSKNPSEKQIINIVHLFLALDSSAINSYDENDIPSRVKLFVDRYLVFDKHLRPGIAMDLNDALLINSGIHVALEPGTAGVFMNKSGRGNAGFDVRAQVVDEDYTGFVHCSLAYTKDTNKDYRKIYCGDKITQMLILPIIHSDYDEVSADEYYDIMSNSERGSDSFGSGDEKH